jgi:hypothetical protein
MQQQFSRGGQHGIDSLADANVVFDFVAGCDSSATSATVSTIVTVASSVT